MHRPARLATAAAMALALVVGSATMASAYPKGHPERVYTASPINACKAIPRTLAQFDIEVPDFDRRTCVKTLAREVPDLPFGNPYEQCAALEAGVETPGGFIQISYPYVFHDEPGDPFPNLRARNRKQCARALYAFHTIESYLPAPPAAG